MLSSLQDIILRISSDLIITKVVDNLFSTDYFIPIRDPKYVGKLARACKNISFLLEGKDLSIYSGDNGVYLQALKGSVKPITMSYSKLYPLDKIPIGVDNQRKAVYLNMLKAPHVLVSGTTGSGKSIFLNNLIQLVDCKLILIDPKKIEFSKFSSLPNLRIPVVHCTYEAINVLSNLVNVMEIRYSELQSNPNAKFYNIVVIIDEFADMVETVRNNKTERELLFSSVIRLAQKSRAIGIHLVLATQRPSVNIITGLIKANVPTRISFKQNSIVDSRTILDSQGAEKLEASGLFLFKFNNSITMGQSFIGIKKK